ncbi:MAG TPA: SAM-dependent methyltransferase [Bacteroidales bacterium]|nr:SAM-dependent methyltransferase [Bacteroidales bacterium]HRW94341.1 SAM-dependent methyltransferase [Bacteroidales bacterium]
MKDAVLYLIPAPLGDTDPRQVIPEGTIQKVRDLRYFVVEELRTARRYLSSLGLQVNTLELELLNEHTAKNELIPLLDPMHKGFSMGLISEAGLPAVADPGAALVALAHENGFRVVPLTGPSSLMLALMGSGLNGQQFAFHGYLPVKPQERDKKIRELEKDSARNHQTQIFIETPYRNATLFRALVAGCNPRTRLTVAIDLTMPDAFIGTRSIGDWRKNEPDFEGLYKKKPCVFLIMAD